MPSTPAFDLTLVIPAFNEAGRLPATLKILQEFLAARPWRVEIVVVDDGSTDATVALAAAAATPGCTLRVVALGRNQGKGAAVKRGVAEAAGTHIAFVDADLPYALDDFDTAMTRLDAGADLVIGGRDLPGSSEAVGYSALRRLSGKIYSLFVNTLAVDGIPDTQCGFKWFRAAAAKRLFPRVSLAGFAFDVEVLVMAQRWGLKIERIPVRLTHSHDSKVRLIQDSSRMFWDLLKINRRRVAGLYDPPAAEGEPQGCPGCGHPEAGFELGMKGYLLARCRGCGLLYLWNRLPEDQLGDFYGNRYYQAGGLHGGYADYQAQKPDLLATAAERIASLKKITASGRLLEVGCSYGYFLEAAAPEYPSPWGVDLSGAAIAVAKENGLNVHAGDLASLPAAAGQFDILYAADLFEHLYQPREFLAQAHARLNPGGILALVTPNEAGWLRKISGRRWVSFKLPEHVAFYTPAYLGDMVRKAGFEPLACHSAGQKVSVGFLLPRLKALSPVVGAVGALALTPWRLAGASLNSPTGNMLFIARKPGVAKADGPPRTGH